VLQASGGAIPLTSEQQYAIAQSGAAAVVAGLRPEHVLVDPEGPIRAVVTVVEALGYENHVVCRLEDDQQVIIRRPAEAAVPREDEKVCLSADRVRMHLFDAATGERIG
jgi:ABC-type sugar transport system ATPase subunit